MKNRITSARTAAEKSTKVETQHPSSHSDGNTFVVGTADLSKQNIQSIFDINNINKKITVINKDLEYLSKKIKKLNALGVQVEINIKLCNVI